MVADAGKKVDINGEPGGAVKVKPVFDPVPTGVVTLTLPDAPAPTIAVINSIESIPDVNELAATPPKLTTDALLKFAPFIRTAVPVLAVVGKKEITKGCWAKPDDATIEQNNTSSTFFIS